MRTTIMVNGVLHTMEFYLQNKFDEMIKADSTRSANNIIDEISQIVGMSRAFVYNACKKSTHYKARPQREYHQALPDEIQRNIRARFRQAVTAGEKSVEEFCIRNSGIYGVSRTTIRSVIMKCDEFNIISKAKTMKVVNL